MRTYETMKHKLTLKQVCEANSSNNAYIVMNSECHDEEHASE